MLRVALGLLMVPLVASQMVDGGTEVRELS
jgi:hypothetical protein